MQDPYRDQAERLRQRIDRNSDATNSLKSQRLPSRSEVHRQKHKKTKWKLKYPILRLLGLFFILLPIIFFSIYTYWEHKPILGSEQVSLDGSSGYDTVDFEHYDEDKSDSNSIKENSESGTEKQGKVDSTQEKTSTVTVDEHSPNTVDNKVESTKDENKYDLEQHDNVILYHTVKQGETLFRIAMKYYQSQEGIEKIKTANNLQGIEIEAGQTLRIPIHKNN